MTKEILHGEIQSLEIMIREELEDIDLEDDVEILQEAFEKIKKLRADYTAKTITLSKIDNDYKIEETEKNKDDMAKVLKSIRTKKKDSQRLKKQNEATAAEDLRKAKETEEKKKDEKPSIEEKKKKYATPRNERIGEQKVGAYSRAAGAHEEIDKKVNARIKDESADASTRKNKAERIAVEEKEKEEKTIVEEKKKNYDKDCREESDSDLEKSVMASNNSQERNEDVENEAENNKLETTEKEKEIEASVADLTEKLKEISVERKIKGKEIKEKSKDLEETEKELGIIQEKFKKVGLEDDSLKKDQKNTNVRRKKIMQLLKPEKEKQEKLKLEEIEASFDKEKMGEKGKSWGDNAVEIFDVADETKFMVESVGNVDGVEMVRMKDLEGNDVAQMTIESKVADPRKRKDFVDKGKANQLKIIFVLTEAFESKKYAGMDDLLKVYNDECGLKDYNRAIPDFEIPTAGDLVNNILDITHHLVIGDDCLIHCTGGTGRTGMVVAAIVQNLGVYDAVSRIRKVKSTYVETKDQEIFLKNMPKAMDKRAIAAEHLIQVFHTNGGKIKKAEDQDKARKNLDDKVELLEYEEGNRLLEAYGETFDLIDKDGNGVLDMEELEKWFSMCEAEIDTPKVVDILLGFKCLTRERFAKLMCSSATAHKEGINIVREGANMHTLSSIKFCDSGGIFPGRTFPSYEQDGCKGEPMEEVLGARDAGWSCSGVDLNVAAGRA